jgi:2-hydroxychromene-2-carboxylate isomerase
VHVATLDSHRSTAGSRRRQGLRSSSRPALYFDLASPYTYLAAERAERLFAGLRWLPASSERLGSGATIDDGERLRVAQRAAAMGLPIVWPVGPPVRVVGAMRVAALASDSRRSAAFVLAATRLLFCGGFDIDEPEILAEAAAAAGIDLAAMLHAAGDARRDLAIAQAGRRLEAAGADRLPVLSVGRRLFCGEHRLSEAAVAARTAG